MPQVNPLRRRIVINNNAGVFTVIRLTTWAKYVEIEEDPSANAGVLQGLQGNALDPFAQSSNIEANDEPLESGKSLYTFGDQYYRNAPTQAPLGNPGSGGNIDVPGGQPTLGTPLAEVRSNSVNATAVWIREYA